MINYQHIQDSIDYYEKRGFKRIESPWIVPEWIDNITKPKDVRSMKLEHNGKCLVASGEQSFLYLMHKEFLPPGRYQTVTPCFRQDHFDPLHSKYFIKNELIKTDSTTCDDLRVIVSEAFDFFVKMLPGLLPVVVKTKIGFDIQCNYVELGSYGIREAYGLKWIYGTALAEPRFSKLKVMNGLS